MSAPVRLFVYGSLMPGHEAWPLLEIWAEGEARADTVPGVLYDTGRGYPAATFDGAPASVVHGFVVDLDPERATDALDTLDRYEAEEYDRIVVRTAGGVDAHTYHWTASLHGCRPVPDGMWHVA